MHKNITLHSEQGALAYSFFFFFLLFWNKSKIFLYQNRKTSHSECPGCTWKYSEPLKKKKKKKFEDEINYIVQYIPITS